jgi:RNA polymerase sigma-70 factor (ECF subfamily)
VTEGSADTRSDTELLAAHAAGDADAFGEVVRRHRDRLWAVALRTLGDREEAADALQDALVSALRASSRAGEKAAAASFRGESAVTTWLHRIVVNACLDRLRRDKPTSELPEYELSDKRDAEGSVDTRLDVREALERLPEGQRMALILVDMHGLSVAEAAAVLEVAEGTVKSRCSRGRDAMAELLREPSGQP